jgi:hypothetical protein
VNAGDLDPGRRVWRGRRRHCRAVHLAPDCPYLDGAGCIGHAAGDLFAEVPVCTYCAHGASWTRPERREPEVQSVAPGATVYAAGPDGAVAHLDRACHRLPDEPEELAWGDAKPSVELCKYCTGEVRRSLADRLLVEARR